MKHVNEFLFNNMQITGQIFYSLSPLYYLHVLESFAARVIGISHPILYPEPSGSLANGWSPGETQENLKKN